MTVACVAPGSASIASEPSSPTDVQPVGPALEVAREDRERRELRRGSSRGGSKASTATRWRPLSPAASSGPPGSRRRARSSRAALSRARRAAVDAQRAQVDACEQVVARRRAADGRRCTERAADGATREPRGRDQRDGGRRRKAAGGSQPSSTTRSLAQRVAAAVGRGVRSWRLDARRGGERLRERLGGGRVADERDRHGGRRCRPRSGTVNHAASSSASASRPRSCKPHRRTGPRREHDGRRAVRGHRRHQRRAQRLPSTYAA